MKHTAILFFMLAAIATASNIQAQLIVGDGGITEVNARDADHIKDGPFEHQIYDVPNCWVRGAIRIQDESTAYCRDYRERYQVWCMGSSEDIATNSCNAALDGMNMSIVDDLFGRSEEDEDGDWDDEFNWDYGWEDEVNSVGLFDERTYEERACDAFCNLQGCSAHFTSDTPNQCQGPDCQTYELFGSSFEICTSWFVARNTCECKSVGWFTFGPSPSPTPTTSLSPPEWLEEENSEYSQ